MKVVILGASGVIGQHMRLCIPMGAECTFVRRKADRLHIGVDLDNIDELKAFLEYHRPDVVVNLAGESNTDTVEREPWKYHHINTVIPDILGKWCESREAHLIQVSSQAVFSGVNGPYSADTPRGPVNAYGIQKRFAENKVSKYQCVTVVRPTFVLGVRPLPLIGRINPAEQMLSGPTKQVVDRWFSVSFARDVAQAIWRAATERPGGTINIGLSDKLSRYDVARLLDCDAGAVSHDSFSGIAPRPIDTTYAGEEQFGALSAGIDACLDDWKNRTKMNIPQRAREIALFLGKNEDVCLAELSRGWHAIHSAVSEDWRAVNPQTDEEILEWYRRTEAYIWELSFYHADPGWNYAGMCVGITDRLKAAGVKKVLCLGDGVGDLTIGLIQTGMDAHYHDLAGSRTAAFADFRSWMYLGKPMPARLSPGWVPEIGVGEWDAIVSLDFLEHVTDVQTWVAAIKCGLKPGGLFCAQNAFAIGSGPDGPMPMHLARNDKYETCWDPTLFGIGFKQLSSNWYESPKEQAVAA